MKYLLIILLFLTTVVLAEEDKQKITIGLGPYIQTQPYLDTDDILLISPVVFYDNGVFYIRWSRAGVYFLGNKGDDFSWGMSLTVQPRVQSLDPSSSEILQGINEKKSTFEGGLALSLAYKDAYVESMLLTDILDHHDSWIVKTEAGYDFNFGDLKLYPSLILIYQSSKFLNYYYGVTESEADKSAFNFYHAGSGFQIGAETYIKYPITKNLSTLINLRVDKLPKTVTDSPLIETDLIYSGLVSLIYTFEY
jgi:outer membrane protein